MTQLTCFSTMLFLCFVYSVLDVIFMDGHDACMSSMQSWLVISYVNVLLFWCLQKVGQRSSHAGENFIISLRQKSLLSASVILFTWGCLVPFFAVWTVLGTMWVTDTLMRHPHCLALGSRSWLVIFWQLLSYIWICIYVIYYG